MHHRAGHEWNGNTRHTAQAQDCFSHNSKVFTYTWYKNECLL